RKQLRYSSNVARMVNAAIEDSEGLNQKKLAEQIAVSPQYISKILKGEENLSLETIAKLSVALGVELISFPEYEYSKHITISPSGIFVRTVERPSLTVAFSASMKLNDCVTSSSEKQDLAVAS